MPGPGILSAILDTTGKRADERIKQSNDMEDAMRKTQTTALLSAIYATDENTGAPKLSQSETEEAWGRIEKLNTHNKGAKDIIAKARDITAKIMGKGGPGGGGNPAMAQRAQTQTESALSGGGGGALVAPPQAPPAGAPPAPDASQQPGPDADQEAAGAYTGLTPPPQRTSMPTPGPQGGGPMAAATAPIAPPAPPPRTTMAQFVQAGAPPNKNKEEIDKEGRANVEWTRREAITEASKLEQIKATAVAHGDKKIAQYIGDDGKLHLIFSAADGTKYEQDSEGNVRPYVSRLSPGSHLSVSDAQSLSSELGQQFLDEKGNPLDVAKLHIQEELIPITGGLPNRYKVATQNQSTITANNLVSAVPALEKTNPAAQVPLGAARVGTEGTAEIGQVDAQGNPILTMTRSTSTPSMMPPAGQPPAPPARPSPGFSTAERQDQLNIARPVRAAAVQIFGDMNNPDVESLASFSKLADNPESRKRVGAAARLVINDLSAADKAGGVGAQILGTGASASGGLWGALKNWAGLTQVVSEQQAAATDRAVNALTPEEGRYLNQVMAAYGTVVGLRSLTRGGAYKFSVDSMERELPIIGIADVTNSTIYNNKLAKIANEVMEGTKGISNEVMPEKAFYEQKARELNALGQGRVPGGPTPPPARGGAPAATMRIRKAGDPKATILTGPKGPVPAGYEEVK